jgi:FkbM family methyltransferase
VVSFEPNPECHEFFLDCCHANGLSPEIVPAAVGAEPGTATLTAPVGRSYLGSIVPGVDARWGAEVMRLTVPVISLDSFVAACGLTPDLVKIDVEGGELDVIDGLQRTLKRSAPYVFCEVLPVFDEHAEMGRFRAQRQNRLRQLLGDLDYDVFRIYFDTSVEQVDDFGVHADMTRSNYVFVPQVDTAAFRRLFAARSRSSG